MKLLVAMNHVDIFSADVGWNQVCFETWTSRMLGVALMVYIVESLWDKYRILPWSSLHKWSDILVQIILLHHGDHFWLEQTTLHTQEVNILLVRIFLLHLVRRLSDMWVSPPSLPPSLTSQLYSRKQFWHAPLPCRWWWK